MPPWQSPTHSKDSAVHTELCLDFVCTKCVERQGQRLKAETLKKVDCERRRQLQKTLTSDFCGCVDPLRLWVTTGDANVNKCECYSLFNINRSCYMDDVACGPAKVLYCDAVCCEKAKSVKAIVLCLSSLLTKCCYGF